MASSTSPWRSILTSAARSSTSQKVGWSTPIDRAIDTDSPLLDGAKIKEFLIANCMLGWLAQTTRLDLVYAYSRIAQHSAKPTVAALKAVSKVFTYLKVTKNLCIAQQVYGSEPNIVEFMVKPTSSVLNAFRFYSDSDHAGKSEAQNKRKSRRSPWRDCTNSRASGGETCTFASRLSTWCVCRSSLGLALVA